MLRQLWLLQCIPIEKAFLACVVAMGTVRRIWYYDWIVQAVSCQVVAWHVYLYLENSLYALNLYLILWSPNCWSFKYHAIMNCDLHSHPMADKFTYILILCYSLWWNLPGIVHWIWFNMSYIISCDQQQVQSQEKTEESYCSCSTF